MRRIFCLLIALLVCMSAALPVFAAEGDFVPSIEYKDGPGINKGTLGEDDVTACLVITTIEGAKDGSTDISQEERDLLLKLYDELTSGEMSLPLEHNHTILELLDVSFKYEGCVTNEDHADKEELLSKDGVTLIVDFDIDVPNDAGLQVLVYHDDEWVIVENVTINDDGTVTVEFEDIGPVAFTVRKGYSDDTPQTGDQVGSNMVLWVSLLALSAVALVAVIVLSKRKTR